MPKLSWGAAIRSLSLAWDEDLFFVTHVGILLGDDNGPRGGRCLCRPDQGPGLYRYRRQCMCGPLLLTRQIGLGLETCRALASQGANVVMAARSPEKGQDAVKKIKEGT